MNKNLVRELLEAAFDTDFKVPVKEATMNDIPHEIDDVVHRLKSMRFDMEEVKKTWEFAGMNLAPLDQIIDGINNLIKTVYDCGAKLADQQIGSDDKEESSLKEDDGFVSTSEDPDWKPMPLADVLEFLKKPENEALGRAFKRVIKTVRDKDPEESEIAEVLISDSNSLKIFFKNNSRPVFAYFDGGISV